MIFETALSQNILKMWKKPSKNSSNQSKTEVFCVVLSSWRIYHFKHGRKVFVIVHHWMVIEQKIFMINVIHYHQCEIIKSEIYNHVFGAVSHIPWGSECDYVDDPKLRNWIFLARSDIFLFKNFNPWGNFFLLLLFFRQKKFRNKNETLKNLDIFEHDYSNSDIPGEDAIKCDAYCGPVFGVGYVLLFCIQTFWLFF